MYLHLKLESNIHIIKIKIFFKGIESKNVHDQHFNTKNEYLELRQVSMWK